MTLLLINEAVTANARQHKACAVLGTGRTLRRWRRVDTRLPTTKDRDIERLLLLAQLIRQDA